MVTITPKKEDRRKYLRIKFKNEIKVHPVTISKSENIFEANGSFLTVKSIDLSEEGIRLEPGKSMPLSQILKIEIKMNNNETIDVYVRLVWSSEKYLGYKFIFLDPKAEDSIRDFMNRLIK